jgi:hypothetical protein
MICQATPSTNNLHPTEILENWAEELNLSSKNYLALYIS